MAKLSIIEFVTLDGADETRSNGLTQSTDRRVTAEAAAA